MTFRLLDFFWPGKVLAGKTVAGLSFETRQITRLVNAARPVAVLLAFLALAEATPGLGAQYAAIFLVAYFFLAIALVLLDLAPKSFRVSFPPEIDAIALAFFVAVTPSIAAFWLFFIFVAFALAARGRSVSSSPYQARPRSVFASDAAFLSAGAAVAVIIRSVWLPGPGGAASLPQWIALGAATYFGGLCVGWLGIRERSLVGEHRLIETLLGALRVEKGVAESVRMVLSELAREFDCEFAYLILCDEEIERLFLWKADQDRRHAIPPEVHPLMRAGSFLAEDLSQTICWNSLKNPRKCFGWNRETGERLRNPEPPPAAAREMLGAKSVMAATVVSAGHPAGRMLLVNARREFARPDLQLFERVVRQLNVPLENLFLLRSLRTRAVESERSRISRDLHDGILQTLLSLNIQLEVLHRKLPESPEQVRGDLAVLQKTIREEGDELRQMVKDLRPLRVESADLREMMYGFAERYHAESGLAVDLFLEESDLRAPDRICREVFQIYRESLNNIKKHARASHVVVKLWQDDTKVFLVVDDNGQGFSFSGRFASEELDRLRLGPISIKERTRTVGGVLTVESNPGHGARLTIEIPLN